MLLVVVVVLAGVAVAVDRVALHYAEGRAATTLRSSQGLTSTPDVSVAGFPFLTQLAAGEFDEITITAHDVSSGSRVALKLADVVVHLHHVTVSNNYSSFAAQSATADGRITYAELSRVLGATVRNAGGGRLVAEPTVTVLGRTYTGRVSAVVRGSAADGIRFVDPRVTVTGTQLPDVVTEALGQVFSTGISLAGLPFGITLDKAVVGSDALELALTGRNLSYSK